jgi:predicted RNase H-like nuclease (RuvC/YqgF family)
MDALLELNRGAPDGEHTEIVKKLIADAIARKDVSASKVMISASPMSASTAGQTEVNVIERQAMHVQELQDENDQLKSRIFELESELEESRAEVEALRAELHGKVGARL